MSRISYLNLDRGEVIPSTPDEFTENAVTGMTAWLLDVLEHEGYVSLPGSLRDYSALIDAREEGLVCSLYAPARLVQKEEVDEPDEGVPLLIFGIALANGKSLWDFFMQGFYIGDRVITMPAEPWITVIPYQMYRYLPDPEPIVRFQKCVARAWIKVQENLP